VAGHVWRSDRSRPTHAHPRTLRPVITAVLSGLVTVAVLLLGGATAHAGPTVAEIEKQIDQAWNKLEPIIEQHNATRQDLAKKRKQAQALAQRIRPLQVQVDLAMARVGEVAAMAYKGGNASAINALLSSRSPTALTDQLAVLDHFARRQQAEIRSVAEAKAKLDQQKAPLDVLLAQLTRTEADLAAKAKTINAEIKKLQELRLKAYGTTIGLGSLRPAPCPYSYPGGAAGVAVKYACAQIGKPYSWGADGPGSYDCSGLTMASWAKAGVYLPHNAAAQRRAIPYVSRSNLRPGDLVFYYSDLHHVAMYTGGGWVVHASRAGEPVKMKRMDDGYINSYGRPG
jgi:cell wall-associated NlpC family hydrolase